MLDTEIFFQTKPGVVFYQNAMPDEERYSLIMSANWSPRRKKEKRGAGTEMDLDKIG